jgi:putative chitinase
VILTAQQLSLATGSRIDRAEARLESYMLMMRLYEINTRLRMACFLANVGHESGGFKYASEIWGDTAAQKRYEGRRDLGNVFPGDGRKYAGHGDMQITGRANHAAARDRLREQKHHAWGWTADVIDALFFWQANHCREQFDREKAAGGVWKAWAAS